MCFLRRVESCCNQFIKKKNELRNHENFSVEFVGPSITPLEYIEAPLRLAIDQGRRLEDQSDQRLNQIISNQIKSKAAAVATVAAATAIARRNTRDFLLNDDCGCRCSS
jgi:hypothetical protein